LSPDLGPARPVSDAAERAETHCPVRPTRRYNGRTSPHRNVIANP